MKEAIGDLWTYPAQWRVITTNGTVKANGDCVMGRGVAAQAKARWPSLPMLLGAHLNTQGNVPCCFTQIEPKRTTHRIITLPVKHHWHERADLTLIEASLQRLNHYPASAVRDVVLPRPGCGNGGLLWVDVKPLCERILDDRFTVVSLA